MLGLVVAGCSSDGGAATGEDRQGEQQATEVFCEAADEGLAADDAGDPATTYDLLRPFVEDLPGDVGSDLEAFLDSTKAANNNPDPGDGDAQAAAADRFRTYVDDRCG